MSDNPGCPICGANTRALAKAGDDLMLMCEKCGLILKEAAGLGRERIQQLQDGVYVDASSRHRVGLNRRMAEDRLRLLTRFKATGRLLEIGCATGEFLQAARTAGFEAVGVDASTTYAAFGREHGLDVRCGRLDDVGFNESEFDVIAMIHLIEHIEDPVSFMMLVAKYLAPGGIVFVVTPNVASFTNKPYGYKHPNFQQPDHLIFYSCKTLNALVRKIGLEVLAVRTREYPHHVFSSAKGCLSQLSKHGKRGKVVPAAEQPSPSRTVSAARPSGKGHLLKLVVNKAPWYLGALFYPILRPYGTVVERLLLGHDLILVARKPDLPGGRNNSSVGANAR